MAQGTYQSVVLAQRPNENIIPGETFSIKTNPSATESDLKDGQVLIEALYLSLDPAMRGWLNDERSYLPPVQIGETMRGAVVGKVVATKSSDLSIGSYVTVSAGWTELAIVNAKECQKTDVPKNGKVTDALGVLGLTGLTAYFGLIDIGKVKAGDNVVVTGAAGATGSVVCQIAKLKGANVLGIAGSDDKVQWLKELGCDEALNYKDPDLKNKFRAATKDYIDVFFDNVGGEVLDMALTRAKEHARFVMCGGISQYNTRDQKGPKNYLNIVKMRIRMEGFIVFDYAAQFSTARKELSQWLGEGKIQRKETILKGGLKAAEQGLVNLYKGINTGKLLVEIKADPQSSRL
ncbi:hypothetical protein MMC19_001594 [Ptychographa xylographoides]|nr:hypothetical protein [Ptychographa xylographoides]